MFCVKINYIYLWPSLLLEIVDSKFVYGMKIANQIEHGNSSSFKIFVLFRGEIFIQLPIVYILTWVLPVLLIATCYRFLPTKKNMRRRRLEKEINELLRKLIEINWDESDSSGNLLADDICKQESERRGSD